MKFVVMDKHGSYVLIASSFEDAFEQVYSDHTGYSELVGIVRIPDE